MKISISLYGGESKRTVLRGVPFREAYQQVGREVQGTFSFEPY